MTTQDREAEEEIEWEKTDFKMHYAEESERCACGNDIDTTNPRQREYGCCESCCDAMVDKNGRH